MGIATSRTPEARDFADRLTNLKASLTRIALAVNGLEVGFSPNDTAAIIDGIDRLELEVGALAEDFLPPLPSNVKELNAG
jgi:hypothetical protein